MRRRSAVKVALSACIGGALCFQPALPTHQQSQHNHLNNLSASADSSNSNRRRKRTSDRPRRPPPNGRSRARTTATAIERKRAPHQFDHTKEEPRPFTDCPETYVKQQSANLDAPLFKFSDDDAEKLTPVKEGTHIQSISLDTLFPNLSFSKKFCSDSTFRDDLRNSMREDVFNSTPAYSGMSEKARSMLLLPDSSLQGSWNCRQFTSDGELLRMKKLTAVLKQYLGEDAPTGDAFMETIGSLCGSKPSTHWIDIVGVMDRRIPHSWHQDTGRSHNGDTKTVLLGFSKEDNYNGVGVFSHAVKLKFERVADDEHPPNVPVVYPGLVIQDEYIVKPNFSQGSELIVFSDVDTLHSAPDVAYRSSVMRFM